MFNKNYEVFLKRYPGNLNRYISRKDAMKNIMVKRLFAMVRVDIHDTDLCDSCSNVRPLNVPRVLLGKSVEDVCRRDGSSWFSPGYSIVLERFFLPLLMRLSRDFCL